MRAAGGPDLSVQKPSGERCLGTQIGKQPQPAAKKDADSGGCIAEFFPGAMLMVVLISFAAAIAAWVLCGILWVLAGVKPQSWDDWFGDKRDETGAAVPLEDWKGWLFVLCALVGVAAAIYAVFWLGLDLE